jgi:hypothetical protein
MRALALAALALVAVPAPAPAYIAVSAERLTLCEVMLEFPTVLDLTLDKFDAEKGAFVFTASALQGKKPDAPLRFALLDGGTTHKRFARLAKGARAVAFLGSPDNRSLVYCEAGWFLTKPDQGWERFTQFRDDFRALCDGTPDELARACAALAVGGEATVPVRSKGVEGDARPFARYSAQFPHRRFPALDPNAKPPAAGAKVVVARHRAALQTDAEPDLLKALTDAHPEVRAAAAFALGTRKEWSKDAIGALAKALEDDDRFVCGFAALALGRAGASAKPATDALLKALGDRNFDHDFRPHRAAEAAEALLRIAPNTDAANRAVAFFLTDRMLNDQRIDSEGTRTAAARALGRSGAAAKGALPDLVKRLTDPLPATRVAAAEAVHLVGGDAKQREAAAKVLAKECASADAGTRVQALRACAASRDADLLPAVRKCLSDSAAEVKDAAREALAVLAKP